MRHFLLVTLIAFSFISCKKSTEAEAGNSSASITPGDMLPVVTSSEPQQGGNGQGYGGGDTILSGVRKLLIRGLKRFQGGFEASTFAAQVNCDLLRSAVLCQRINSMTKEQRAFVNAFLKSTIKQFIDLNTTKNPTGLIVVSEKLSLNDSKGATRDLGAMTVIGPYGDIIFSESALIVITDRERVALLAHEFGHKVSFNGKYITDNDPIGPFTGSDGGRKFLDAFGASVAAYLAQTENKASIYTNTNPVCDTVSNTLDIEYAPYFGAAPEGEIVDQQHSNEANSFLNSITTGNFAVSIWAQLDEEAANDHSDEAYNILFSNFDLDDRYMGGLSLFRGKEGNFWIYAGNDKGFDTGLNFTGGVYHHIVAVKNGNQLASFMDGKKGAVADSRYINRFDDSDVSPGTLKSFLPSAQVGRAANPTLSYWQGRIARIQIINKAITESEVQTLYKCGLTPP